MAISSLSGYAALLNLQSQQTASTSTSNTSTADANSSASVGDEILSLLKSSQTTSDPLLQDTVTLSPAALGQTSTSAPLTYDAKGLLKQAQSIQNSLALNDPLLRDNSDSGFDSTTEINPGSLFNSI